MDIANESLKGKRSIEGSYNFVILVLKYPSFYNGFIDIMNTGKGY